MAERTTPQFAIADWYDVKKMVLVTADAAGQPVAVKTSNGYLQLAPATVTPYVVLHAGAALEVSTLTPLIAFVHLGDDYESLLFYAANIGAVDATVTLETSEDGEHPDSSATETKNCNAGEQCSFELGPGILRQYWRLSAQTASGSTLLRAGARGIPRGGV